MTERELRERIVARARSLLGLREADGSFRRIVEAYNRLSPLPRGYRLRESDPWCAAFVSAVGQMEGLSELLLPECSCDRMIGLYRPRGLWRTRDDGAVQPGDLVFYNWDWDASVDHVGLIAAVGDEDYEVIEGNCSDAVAVRRVPKDWRFLAGFALPDYAGAAGEECEAPEDAPEERASAEFALPLLGRGDRGESVLAMQAVLLARGCGCGPDGADGDFGPNTEAALKSFQRDAGLASDGICGPATWAALLGVRT